MCRIGLDLYAHRSARNLLLVLGLLLLLLDIKEMFHYFLQPNPSASYEENSRTQEIFKYFSYQPLRVG